MSLPYQSKFLYRGRRNSPVPHASRFAGFDGPQYTLGSLSNKSGVDWALPRYVRDAPLMYMAGDGLGLTLDEILAAGGVSKEQEESWGQDSGFNIPGTDISIPGLPDLPPELQDVGSKVQSFIQEYGSKAEDLINKYGQTAINLFKAGMTAKQVYDKLTGGGQQLPPSYQYTPPPTPTTEIPPAYPPKETTPTYPKFQMMQASIAPSTVKIIEARAAKKIEEQKKSQTNTLLILGAVGLGAYLLLRKK